MCEKATGRLLKKKAGESHQEKTGEIKEKRREARGKRSRREVNQSMKGPRFDPEKKVRKKRDLSLFFGRPK